MTHNTRDLVNKRRQPKVNFLRRGKRYAIGQASPQSPSVQPVWPFPTQVADQKEKSEQDIAYERAMKIV